MRVPIPSSCLLPLASMFPNSSAILMGTWDKMGALQAQRELSNTSMCTQDTGSQGTVSVGIGASLGEYVEKKRVEEE